MIRRKFKDNPLMMTMIGRGGAGRSPTTLAAFALVLAAGSVLALSASRVVLRARTNGDNGSDDSDDGELGERTAAAVVASAVTSLPPAIRAEMLSRNSLYFGPSGQTSAEGSSVVGNRLTNRPLVAPVVEERKR